MASPDAYGARQPVVAFGSTLGLAYPTDSWTLIASIACVELLRRRLVLQQPDERERELERGAGSPARDDLAVDDDAILDVGRPAEILAEPGVGRHAAALVEAGLRQSDGPGANGGREGRPWRRRPGAGGPRAGSSRRFVAPGMPPGRTTICTADGSMSSTVQSGVTAMPCEPVHGPGFSPAIATSSSCAAEDVDDRDGLDLLESRGERDDDGGLLHGELRNCLAIPEGLGQS